MTRECVSFEDSEDLRELAWGGGTEDFSPVARQHEGNTRWGALYLNVIKRNSDGKLFGGVSEIMSGETEDEDLASEYCEVDTIPSVTYYITGKIMKLRNVLRAIEELKIEEVTLHEVDIHIDTTSGFGTRNVKAVKTTDPGGRIAYTFTVEVPKE
jgi:hypothetical protein